MESILATLKSKLLVGGASALFFLFLARKLYNLSRAKHSIILARKGEKQIIDAALFPQYFANPSGLWLYTRKWEVSSPKAVVFICHGYGEHIGRYEHIAEYFNSRSISCYGLDHQGHGQSEGDSAHVENFDEFHQDFIQFVKHVVARNSRIAQLPRFLLGHSMGGLIGTRVILNSSSSSSESKSESKSADIGLPWSGFIASSPALSIDPSVDTPFMRFLARILSHTLPKLPVSKLDAATVSRIPQVTTRYKSDPLVYNGGIRANFGSEMLRAIADVITKYKEIKTNLLVIHGTADRLTSIVGSRALYEKVSSGDKSFLPYDGGFHELMNDLDHAAVLADITKWIENHI